MRFQAYSSDGFYDELFCDDGTPRNQATLLVQRIESLTDGELQRRQAAAEQMLMNLGITFNVYGHDAGTERVFPFDLVPRIITPENPMAQACSSVTTPMSTLRCM